MFINKLRTTIRFLKLLTLLVAATIYVPLLFLVPVPNHKANQMLMRHKIFHVTLKGLLGILKVKIHVHGTPMNTPGAYISNHVSWLDVPLMGSVRFSTFVAKDDVESWPLVGTITKKIGTIYIDRTNKFATYRCLPRVEKQIKMKRQVVFFPEGTTSSGLDTLTFYPMFFETICRTQSKIQPMVIRYSRPDGSYCSSIPFIDDMTFLGSLLNVLSEPEIHAHITYLEPIDANQQHRKILCKLTKSIIDQELQKQLAESRHDVLSLHAKEA